MSIVCLVTDRRQLGAADEVAGCQRLLAQIREAADAGVDLVQLREPDLSGRALFEIASAAVRITRGTKTRLLVNDRVDVALAAGADGVHLRGASFPAARLRPVVPVGFLIGRSVHSLPDACAAEAAGALDYLIAGTVFPSRSKPAADTLIGAAGLRDFVRAVSLPVLAIGGVTLSTLPQAVRAGAAGFAAIGLFIPAGPGARRMAGVVTEARRLFDTPGTIP